MIVYKATNKINGKYYIGITTRSFKKRIREHEINSKYIGTYFTRSLNKYGSENFTWEIIDTADDIEMLKIKEMFWIWHWQSHGPLGYNETEGGEGTLGYKYKETQNKGHISIPEETKYKISLSLQKLWEDSIYRKKMIESHKGRIHTIETKEKMSKSHKGIKYSKPRSDSWKQKQSIAHKNKPWSESRRKAQENNRGI